MRKPFTSIVVSLAFVYSFILAAPVLAEQAPGFALPGDNHVIDLENYRGKVVYLDFWASWCDPCRRSFPWMNQLQGQYEGEDFAVIAINLDESREDAREFLKVMPARFDVAFDDSGATAEAYELKAMPSSFIIDKNGKLIKRVLGYRTGEKRLIERKIRELLDEEIVASR